MVVPDEVAGVGSDDDGGAGGEEGVADSVAPGVSFVGGDVVDVTGVVFRLIR